MKRTSILITIILVIASFSGCVGQKVNNNPSNQSGNALRPDDVLRAAKTFGSVLSGALDQGIALEKALAENGTIDPEVEPGLRRGLQDAKTAVSAFNARAASYTTFDATSKADIAKLLDDTIAFIAEMNANGLLHIKNPRSQLIASGILLGASTAVNVFKATFDSTQ